ncbi:MAG: leucine-rich repeat protein [Acutalibacteraceae bacterium]|nr:leucine-rich repeat protein [Acutalibacteraceae bacterium]
MKIKRVLAVFLSVLVLCSLFFAVPVSALQYSGGFAYERSSSTLIEIVGFQPNASIESSEIVTIPEKLRSYTVYRIGKNAFSYNDVQKEIIMPDTVTEIGDYAFTKATKLTTVAIPKNVQILGAQAFSSCTALESVIFNTTSLSLIPRSAFYGCTSLDDVILPSTINSIDTMAFASCTNLNRIYIPPTVSSIKADTFLYCNNLTIYGEEDSSVYYYALKNNIPFVNFTADKTMTELNNSISLAQAELSGDTSGFVPEIVSQLRAELSKAETLKNDFFTTQEQINQSALAISQLCNQLRPTNLAPVREVIAKANEVLKNSNLYTQASVDVLSGAVNSAQDLLNKSNPTDTEVENIVNLVNEKIDALVLKSKVNLQNLVNSMNGAIGQTQYQYTEDSFNNFVNALESAKMVLNSADSTDITYKSAYNNLSTAYNSIVSIIKGDVDLNGEITVVDSIQLLKYVIGTKQFNERELYAADLSQDNNITVLDAVLIQRAIINM